VKRWRGVPLALGALAYLVGALAWLREERALVSPRLFPPGSVYNTDPRGLSLAFAYLRERGGAAAVATLLRPLEPLSVEPGAVVFRVRPLARGARARAELLTPGEQSFLRDGGRLVLALDGPYGPLDVKLLRAAEIRKLFPLWSGTSSLRPAPARALQGAEAAGLRALFAAGDAPILSRRVLGKGDVVVSSAPELFENRLLREADHLGLLASLAGTGRSVYFDERVHGAAEEAGLVALLLAWGLGPTLALGGLAALLAFWRARARLGPAEDEHRETRSEAVDLVDSLGRLYDRTLTRDEALRQHALGFERALQARSGLTGEALRARVRELLGAAPPAARPAKRELSAVEFARRLTALNGAYRRLLDARTR
jgi:hypothetical protein